MKMDAVTEQVAMMFGEYTAQTLYDHGLLREPHGESDDEGSVPYDFYRIHFKLDQAATNHQIGYSIRTQIQSKMREALAAFQYKTNPGSSSSRVKLGYYRYSTIKTDPDSIEKLLGWHVFNMVGASMKPTSLRTVRSTVTQIQGSGFLCRAYGCYITEGDEI